MYNSPVLFDQSSSLVEQFSLLPERTKIAILFDENGKSQIEAFSKETNSMPTTSLQFTKLDDTENIRRFIISQKMGTQFYISCNWDNAHHIFSLLVAEGASEDEIQTYIIGEKKRYIYCMKCFQTSQIPLQEQTVQCSCKAHLEVGPFFSNIRKGYIGYPFIPVHQYQKVGS